MYCRQIYNYSGLLFDKISLQERNYDYHHFIIFNIREILHPHLGQVRWYFGMFYFSSFGVVPKYWQALWMVKFLPSILISYIFCGHSFNIAISTISGLPQIRKQSREKKLKCLGKLTCWRKVGLILGVRNTHQWCKTIATKLKTSQVFTSR